MMARRDGKISRPSNEVAPRKFRDHDSNKDVMSRPNRYRAHYKRWAQDARPRQTAAEDQLLDKDGYGSLSAEGTHRFQGKFA